jgi:DNA-binding MarR family transcriptional regulator
MWLDENGKTRLKDIAAQMEMSASSLCVMFNEMEKEGVILREIDKNDRRNTYYSISEEGKAVVKSTTEYIRAAVLQILEPLSESELKEIADALIVINQIIERHL